METPDPDATAPAPQSTTPPDGDTTVSAGALIGRYITLDTLGRGGGGEVYAAFDPVLDRKVAIKLLHGTEEAKPALIREGRMLAKVVHPSVVEVYEVGFDEGQAFMAMELVGGGDLGAFAEQQRASGRTQPIIDGLLQIADGLVAAHDAGVVHGDIKPSNILRSPAGSFKVSDFGIARLQSTQRAEGTHRPVGTPAFMAPEQHSGAVADERTDQYSFCITAWVALTGALPFSRDSLDRSTDASLDATGPLADDLETLKQEGPPAWPPESRVHSRAMHALVRGLSPTPSDRWPSMAALAAELRPNLTRARVKRGAIGLGLGGAAVLGVLGYRGYQHREAVSTCERAGAEIHQLWSEEASDDVRSSLESSGVSYAAGTAERVLPRLSEWADRWASERVETCSQHAVSGTWDAELDRRAAWCLEEQRLGFAEAVDRLQTSGGSAVDGAVALVTSLPQPRLCGDVASLMRRPAPPPDSEREARVVAIRELATAQALERTGDGEAGLEAIERIKTLLGPDSDSPMFARALEAEGRLLARAGRYSASEAAASQAYALAASREDWTTAAWAAELLIFVVGQKLDRPAEGVAWESHARIASGLAGDPFRLHETTRTANSAVVKRVLGEYDEAIALHERALELATETLGADHPQHATTLGNLAAVYMNTGKVERALELLEEATQLRSRMLGVDHPSTISALGNMAAAVGKSGQLERARTMMTDVLERTERALGPSHPQVGGTLANLGAMNNMLGEPARALPLLERSLAIRRATEPGTLEEASTLSHLAVTKSSLGEGRVAVELLEQCLAIRERVNGPDHALVGEALINLGTEHFLLDDLEQAEAMFRRAKDIYAQALGTSHPGYGAALNNLGDVALASGRFADAIAGYEEAHAVWAKALGPEHPDTAIPQAHAGSAWLELGDATKARPLLERAITTFEASEGKTEQEALARFDLARALATTGDREAAVESAQAARAALVEIGGGQSLTIKDIDAWLAETEMPGTPEK